MDRRFPDSPQAATSDTHGVDPAGDPDEECGVVEQIAGEFLSRRQQGERPSVAEYVARHPELAVRIREVLSALVLVEDLKPQTKPDERPAGQASFKGAEPLDHLGDYRIVRELGRG